MPTPVAAVHVSLPALFFDSYQCNKTMAFPLDARRLCKILRWLDDEELQIKYLVLKEGTQGALKMSFEDNDGQVVSSYGPLFFLAAGTRECRFVFILLTKRNDALFFSSRAPS
jgi:hypothetical protein